MEVKGDTGKISAGNGEHVIENWKKGDPCYKVIKDLVEMCSSVFIEDQNCTQ